MKILQINNCNYLKGGSEKVYQVSIELLKKEGHDVRFFSVADTRNENLCDGVAVELEAWRDAKGVIGRIKGVSKFIYNKQVAKKLDNYIKEFHPDVAHLHIVYGVLSNAIISVLRQHKIPMVQSVHEFRLLCPSYTCLNPQLQMCEKCAGTTFKIECVKKRCIKSNFLMSVIASMECYIRDNFYSYQKNISAFIMVSQFIEDKHLQYYPGMKAKCYQIYNSVDTNAYSKFVVESCHKGDYYLYLGRLSYEKGVGTLIDAFIKNPTLNLKIAGTGPATEELKEKVNTAGVNNIEFLGFLSGDKLYQTIAEARYTMVPSEWYENNPLSVIESLALGTPVIGSKIGGIPELIIDGVNGFLHNSKDLDSLSIILVKSATINMEEYINQCTMCLSFAKEKFDNSVYYTELINVYNNVFN